MIGSWWSKSFLFVSVGSARWYHPPHGQSHMAQTRHSSRLEAGWSWLNKHVTLLACEKKVKLQSQPRTANCMCRSEPGKLPLSRRRCPHNSQHHQGQWMLAPLWKFSWQQSWPGVESRDAIYMRLGCWFASWSLPVTSLVRRKAPHAGPRQG